MCGVNSRIYSPLYFEWNAAQQDWLPKRGLVLRVLLFSRVCPWKVHRLLIRSWELLGQLFQPMTTLTTGSLATEILIDALLSLESMTSCLIVLTLNSAAFPAKSPLLRLLVVQLEGPLEPQG